MNIPSFQRYTSGLSQLPVRNKSKSLTDQNIKLKKYLDYKRPTGKSLSTWSDFSPCCDLRKSYSSSESKLKTLRRICTKIQSRSKPQTVTCQTGFYKIKPFRNLQKTNISVNRNNSSCEKLTNFYKKPKFIKPNLPNYERIKDRKSDINLDPTTYYELQYSNKSNEKYKACSSSIFRLFRMKIDMYREKYKLANVKKIGVDYEFLSNKTNQGCNTVDNPLSRNFLLKLYNECRKLNGNIVKLTKENPEFRSRLKTTRISRNCNNKFQNFLSDLHDTSNIKCNSNNSLSSKSLSNQKSFDRNNTERYHRSQSNCISGERICKTLDENNGHYYHLACVLSSDPDQVNSSKICGRSLNKNPENPLLSRTDCKENKPKMIDDIVSNKTKSSFSSKPKVNDVLNHPNLKYEENNFHQNDDTLFNLDENMSTDSLEDEKVITKDNKLSTKYFATSGNCKTLKQNCKNVRNHSKTESVSSYEMPPLPSVKNNETIIGSQSSFPDNNPPEMNDSFTISKPTKPENASHLPVSQYIAIFEKQFPQQMVLINTKSDNSQLFGGNNENTKFTSSLTINCYKENSRNINKVSEKPKRSPCFFNPFKPPVCNGSKLIPFLNSNNNNSSGSERISDLTKPLTEDFHEFKISKTSSTPSDENEIKKHENDGNNSEPVLKRIAPLKELLMHARNSDKMNSVFTDIPSENKMDPSNNSYIEKQRQKKIIKQKELHQKAKDMAIEAARLRKERQAEIQSFDSYDSSRIIERLFTENDKDYPEFSLYDACHYNFMRKRPNKPRPLAQSTISGILPEEPEQLPEPPKSPVTNEKFRKEPIRLVKRVHMKKEFTKKELEKYEPVSNSKPSSVSEKDLKETNQTQLISISADNCHTNNTKTVNSISVTNQLSDSSSKEEVSGSSISSYSSYNTSLSISQSSSSSSSTESSSNHSVKIKHEHKTSKNLTKSVKRKNRLESKEHKRESYSNHDGKTSTRNKSKNHVKLQNKKIKNVSEINKCSSQRKNHCERLQDKGALKCEEVKCGEVSLQSENRKNMDIQPKRTCHVTNDVSVNTEHCHKLNQPNFRDDNSESMKMTENNILPNNNLKESNPKTHVCHLNHQRNYNENIIDRTLSLSINVPVSDTSLSAFVQELNSQLHSLADTVDILMNRMESFEANLLDSSKYFVYK